MAKTLIVQKVANILASLCEGEWVFVSIFSSEKNQLQVGKKLEKLHKYVLITLFAQKNPERKTIRRNFQPKT